MQRQPWWKEALIYHIYPRSFRDANGDGFGDLAGIIEKLDHIRHLGANAIWMGPVFRSPQIDNGYDISDYREIDPLFGTIEEMDRLIETARRKGIKVLLDLVFNHSSDQHSWFRESVRDPEGPYGDYYIWRDPAPEGGPPNNWRSFFSVPAWTFSPERGQYYLHLFAPEQPDLNWENPRVREELAEVANFWIRRGVAGFRLDVINVISKAPGLPSMVDGERQGLFIDGPKVLEYLREFRERLEDKDEIVLVGETPGVTPEAARRYTLPENRALDMVLIFDHVMLDHGPGGRWDPRPLEIEKLRRVLTDWQATLGAPAWPSVYLSNHDQPRVVSRYGDDEAYRFESATALATAFYLQRGTPIVYQGDEIAMANYPIARPEEIVDIESRNAYTFLIEEEGVDPVEALKRVSNNARDNGRTPMQWSAAEHAGFTASGNTPWYPINPDYRSENVQAQELCPPSEEMEAPSAAVAERRSVLCYFRRLFALRRRERALRAGEFAALPLPEASNLVAYLRESEEEQILVVANLSGTEEAWEPPSGAFELLLSNGEPAGGEHRGGRGGGSGTEDALGPWECRVLRRAP
ncbi:MAG: glycoside hydrolase family 13 protein [Spirochaetaceae bacterium]